jgi:hypothetical protein
VLFPWYHSSTEEFEWIGTEKAKRSFPDGMNCVPMVWTYLDQEIPMKAWAGSMCTSKMAVRWHPRCVWASPLTNPGIRRTMNFSVLLTA